MIESEAKSALLREVNAHIGAILRDPARLETLCTSAYQHPNGFAKLPLHGEANGSVLRIHRWLKGPIADANVHSHRWDMRSVILDGAYRAREYEEAADGELTEKYRCAENRDGRYEIEFFGDFQLRVAGDRSYGTGDRYDMSAGMIHSVDTIESDEVLSLVQCSAAHFDHSWVYAPRGKAPANVAPTRLSSREITQILDRTREALSRLDHL